MDGDMVALDEDQLSSGESFSSISCISALTDSDDVSSDETDESVEQDVVQQLHEEGDTGPQVKASDPILDVEEEDWLRYLRDIPDFVKVSPRLLTVKDVQYALRQVEKTRQKSESEYKKFVDGVRAIAGESYAVKYAGFLKSAKKHMDEVTAKVQEVEKVWRQLDKLQDDYKVVRKALFQEQLRSQHLSDAIKTLKDCEEHPSHNAYKNEVEASMRCRLAILRHSVRVHEAALGIRFTFPNPSSLRVEMNHLVMEDPQLTLLVELVAVENGDEDFPAYSLTQVYPGEIAHHVGELLACFNLKKDLAFFLVYLRDAGEAAFANRIAYRLRGGIMDGEFGGVQGPLCR